jgi:hypothetical protein
MRVEPASGAYHIEDVAALRFADEVRVLAGRPLAFVVRLNDGVAVGDERIECVFRDAEILVDAIRSRVARGRTAGRVAGRTVRPRYDRPAVGGWRSLGDGDGPRNRDELAVERFGEVQHEDVACRARERRGIGEWSLPYQVPVRSGRQRSRRLIKSVARGRGHRRCHHDRGEKSEHRRAVRLARARRLVNKKACDYWLDRTATSKHEPRAQGGSIASKNDALKATVLR